MLSLQQGVFRSSLLRRRLVRRAFETSSPSCTTRTVMRSWTGKASSEHSLAYSLHYDNTPHQGQVPGREVNLSKDASIPWRRQSEEGNLLDQAVPRHRAGKIGSTTSLERRKFRTDTSLSLIQLSDAIKPVSSSHAQNTTKLLLGDSSKYHSDLSPETQSFPLLPTNRVPLTNLHMNGAYRTFSRSWDHRWNSSLSSLVQQQACSFSTQPQQDDAEVEASHSPGDKSFVAPPKKAPKAIPSLKMSRTRVPTPSSSPPEAPNPLTTLAKTTPKNIIRKGLDLTIWAFEVGLRFLWRLPFNILYYLRHPSEAKQYMLDMKKTVMDEVDHYWVGTKLLWADIQTARNLVLKTLQGSSLTRRERKQLLRTVTDLFRVVPFSMFIIIPLGEFALPFVLRVFPNLLPSTFQDSLKEEENMKRELQSRIAMAQFFQETLEELAKEQKRKARKRTKELQEAGVEGCETIDKHEDTAASMLEFLETARSGKIIPPDVIIRYANYFQDDLTLDNMPRMQLINMCKYMNIPPYGSDSFLRFQLRYRIRALKDDDQRILWEGIDSLTKMELREACRERGMRSTGLSKEAYKKSLQQWLDLSVNKDVPIALLIMSRTFFLQEEVFMQKEDESSSLAGLADAISGLDKEVVNEVILQVATSEEKRADPDVRKIKLEVLSKQNELIRAEEEAREAAKKRDKEKAEATKAEAQTTTEPEETKPSPDVAKTTEVPTEETLVAAEEEKLKEKDAEEMIEELDLSPDEMEAIKQLVSDDPVSKERAELEKIKAAMKSKKKADEEAEKEDEAAAAQGESEEEAAEPVVPVSAPIDIPSKVTEPEPIVTSKEADKIAADTITKLDKQVEMESAETTTFAVEESTVKEKDQKEEKPPAEEIDDPVVARLKKRLESMVDKIEVQLTETEVKIGDKLHFLDKDRDGILSPEEMAEVLMQVLKRNISFEEALEIASEMDENRDGFFTVDEFIKWIDRHKLVKFVEEGRDADMDRIIQDHSSSSEQQQQQQQQQQQSKDTEDASPKASS